MCEKEKDDALERRREGWEGLVRENRICQRQKEFVYLRERERERERQTDREG